MYQSPDPRDVSGVRYQRRTIVFADLVESVRIFGEGEKDAIQRWRRFSTQVREQMLPTFGGRLVRTAGDGFLIECEHTVPAVALALQMHEALQEHNADCPDERRMLLRIGIHVDNIAFDEHEAYGAGVNLAARLCGVAPPGSTVVSADVRGEMTDGVDADIDDLGPRYLKHLTEPVRAFAVHPKGRSHTASARLLPRLEDMRPAIAVVPFVSMPIDPAQDALGHAMADDIIAALARHPGLRVLSRASTAAVRHSALTPQELQPLLGAAYLLTGRCYAMGERVRTNVELCEMKSGEVLWTGQMTTTVAALFEGQDELVPHVVANVSQQVMAHEMVRVRSLPLDTLASYSLYLGATALMNSLTPEAFGRAREVIDHLIERHPRHAAPHATLARWHVFNIVQEWAANPATEIARAVEEADRAVDIDPHQAMALATKGLARLTIHSDIEGARRDYEAALSIDPQDALTWAFMAGMHSYGDEHALALEAAERALQLSPLDPNLYHIEAYAAMASIGAGNYAIAVNQAQSSVRRHLLHSPSHLLLIGALWLNGRHADARAAAARALQVCPSLKVGARGRRGQAANQSWRDTLADAARSAGLP